MASPAHAASFPRLPLIGAAGLIVIALLCAATGRLTGIGQGEAPDTAAVSSRNLVFADRADGAVLVYDADAGGAPIAVETGQNGFLRGTLRGFARTRHADGIGAEVPFRLTAWADGRVTLVDPATGRHTDLEAFGSSNVLVFTNFLTPPAATLRSAAVVTPGRATP